MRHVIFFLSFLLCLSGVSEVLADEPVRFTPKSKTPEEIILYVEKSAQLFLDKGEKEAIRLLADPDGPWVDGEWYIFVNNFDGYIIGHINQKLVGKTLLGLRDVKGNAFAAELQRIAKSKKGKGWSEYWWPKPNSTVAEQKVSYILRVPGKKIFVGTGIYGMGKKDIERVLKNQKAD
jgi:cytochrome c